MSRLRRSLWLAHWCPDSLASEYGGRSTDDRVLLEICDRLWRLQALRRPLVLLARPQCGTYAQIEAIDDQCCPGAEGPAYALAVGRGRWALRWDATMHEWAHAVAHDRGWIDLYGGAATTSKAATLRYDIRVHGDEFWRAYGQIYRRWLRTRQCY